MSEYHPWIGVDLDGTLAHAEAFHDETVIGEPIPAMVALVKDWLREGKTVKVFTARAASADAVQEIKAWLLKHGLPDLDVTNLKDKDMEVLYDDRCVQVVKNTGRLVGQQAESQWSESGWESFRRLVGASGL